MSLLDGILSQVSQIPDIKNLAAKVGIDPQQAESAVHALAQAHVAPGDTAQGAAQATGLSVDTISQIIGHIGGEGALAQFAEMIGGQGDMLGQVGKMLDRDGDGNPLNDLGGLASGLFGKK